MVLYKCELCNFETKYTTNYNKHLLSNKHKRNIEKNEFEKQKNMPSKVVNNISLSNISLAVADFGLTQRNSDFIVS